VPPDDLGIPLQAGRLLRALERNGVDFVVIGGIVIADEQKKLAREKEDRKG
jgi:hypothetical protein